MTRFCLTSLYVLLALIFASCRFAQDEDLVDYLRRQGEDTVAQKRLSPPEANVKTGEVYAKDTGRFDFVLTPASSTEDGLVTGLEGVYMKYVIRYCDLTDNNRNTTVYELFREDDTDKEYKIELRTGYYFVEAYCHRSGFLDSKTAVWNFGVGQVADLNIKIEYPNRGSVEIKMESLVFTKQSFDARHTVKVLSIVVRDNNNTIVPLDEVVANANEPVTFELWDKETKYEPKPGDEQYNNTDAYTYILPLNMKYEPGNYKFCVELTCWGITRKEEFTISLLD